MFTEMMVKSMYNQKRFKDFLNGELRARDWNYSDLARAAHVHPSAISHIYTGRRVPKLDLCLGIAKALSIDPDLVLREAGILPPASGDNHDETAELVLYKLQKLPRRERQTIIGIVNYTYERFVSESSSSKAEEP